VKVLVAIYACCVAVTVALIVGVVLVITSVSGQ
jgi:hypothetical protein